MDSGLEQGKNMNKTNITDNSFTPQITTLSSDKVTLRPLTLKYLSAFYNAGNFSDVWRWSLPNRCASLTAAKEWLTYSEQMAAKGEHYPFAIFDNTSGKLVGSTRFCSINRADKNLEIGFTFITPTYQRSYVNSHTKMLLLSHAFETLGAIRVTFKVHEQNEKSRSAVSRLGAKFEGILRHHRILSDGSYRNTVIFSVINTEWPTVKAALIEKMENHQLTTLSGQGS